MSRIAEKFTRLKTRIGGNRERTGYEETFGMPKEEVWHITPASADHVRIISEAEYAMHLSEYEGGRFDDTVEKAIDFLLQELDQQGALTKAACSRAEEMLLPMRDAARSYEVILASHAHIDMNWMWSFDETVAITLSTFRSILNMMEDYPDYCFSQSQGAVYRIVEEYDPGMMEEIRRRIREGRWEVNAAAWVETDKNMPSTESLLRHILYTREYLQKVWGVQDFDVDFSPDTFGHSLQIPEINSFGRVKYYYHCRGNDTDQVLHRWQAPGGSEVMVYREPNWYNGAITPKVGTCLFEVVKKTSGLRTTLAVYGVGNHGGGPTRRDITRAKDMMDWPVFPAIRFGTFRDYFHAAEKIRGRLPAVTGEMNFVSPGCYTTQSRIKRGNRHLENALLDTEAVSALASLRGGFVPSAEKMKEAWRKVLFTHFHDILTGSCVQDSREHAMGLYQEAKAQADAQMSLAFRSLCSQIDTSAAVPDPDTSDTQSEGAGGGYGISFLTGVPGTERGSGLVRVFHLFNTRPYPREQAVEIRVWDWLGDLKRMQFQNVRGENLPFQLLDTELQNYWDHRYVRVLVQAEIPAFGYTTVILSQKEQETYPVYLQNGPRSAGVYDDRVLENRFLRAEISAVSGRIVSLVDKSTGAELLAEGQSAGLSLLETERSTSSAWSIGRTVREETIDRCLEMRAVTDGPVRQSVSARFSMGASEALLTYFLDMDAQAVGVDIHADWHGAGKETVPVLRYEVPLRKNCESYRFDVPAGSVIRPPRKNDVPGLQYAMALDESGKGRGLILISDSKYGYRAEKERLSLTLINSSVSPDPYPERGIHDVRAWIGAVSDDAGEAERLATDLNRGLIYQSAAIHGGTLPPEDSLMDIQGDGTEITSVAAENHELIIRGYESKGKKTKLDIHLAVPGESARRTDLLGQEQKIPVIRTEEGWQTEVDAMRLFEVRICFAKSQTR